MSNKVKLTKRGERVLTVLSVAGFILAVYLISGIWWECDSNFCGFTWIAPFTGGIDG